MADDAGEDLSWTPDRCPRGHELGPGRVSLSYVNHRCPLSLSGHGHHVAFCRTCDHPDQMIPAGCTLAGTATSDA